MDYSLIIPVYNGEHTVRPLMQKISSFFDQTNYTYEVIFVYDCGPDNSWNILLQLKDEYKDLVKLVKLSRNFGQHNALICGFEYAQGDFIITMDEDLQHDPFDIKLLIDKQREDNADVVYGIYEVKMHNRFRNITSRIMKWLVKVGIPELDANYSAYRLIKADMARATVNMRNSYTFLDGYLSWITTNTSSCLVSHHNRLAGVSSYNIKKLVTHSINIFVTFSDLPIKIVSWLSFIFLIFTGGYSLVMLLKKLIYNDVLPGFTSLVILLGFGIGALLFSISILGQYLYRINLKTTKRPNYNIEKTVE